MNALMHDISNVDELISALGGPDRIAAALSISQPAVSQWRTRGIPGGWHLRLYLECHRLHLSVDIEAVFDVPHQPLFPDAHKSRRLRDQASL